MFGIKDKQAGNKSMTPGGAAHNLLVKGTYVKGDVKSETDIRIDGVVEGTLACDAKVVIGPTGYVQGTITCRDAVIEGRIEGNIKVSELLNLRKTAQLKGEIETSKLIVEAGAIFTGQVRMGKQNVNSGNSTAGKPNAFRKEAS
jgi:cytoskeletal protein CcmA (bactofilin family)